MNQSPINRFLLENGLRIASNPCVSPDFCLDWPALHAVLSAGEAVKTWTKSAFETKAGSWTLLEHTATGDCGWRLELRAGATVPLDADGRRGAGRGRPGLSCDVQEPDRAEEPDSGAQPGLHDFPDGRAKARPEHARHWRSFHHAALAGRGVGDERAGDRRDRQSELDPTRVGLRRRCDHERY